MIRKKSKKRTRKQTTKGNSGISPPTKRAGTAKTVRMRSRSNTIQTTLSEWVLDEELPMSQYNSANPHTQAADPHKYTTKPITTNPTPNHKNPICSPTSQITDNKSSDTNRTPTENEKTFPPLVYTDRRYAKPHSVTTVSFKWAREQYPPIANHKCVNPSSECYLTSR